MSKRKANKQPATIGQSCIAVVRHFVANTTVEDLAAMSIDDMQSLTLALTQPAYDYLDKKVATANGQKTLPLITLSDIITYRDPNGKRLLYRLIPDNVRTTSNAKYSRRRTDPKPQDQYNYFYGRLLREAITKANKMLNGKTLQYIIASRKLPHDILDALEVMRIELKAVSSIDLPRY